jgi:hypothetical protein
MGKGSEGRRAWRRLDEWWQGERAADRALTALGDIGALRRLLDQAELAAVRVARGAGKSWAEIATQLGVTRQSAWERWRELDERPVEPATRATAESVPLEVFERAAAERRRRAAGVVPNVVGLTWVEASAELATAGLVAIRPERELVDPPDDAVVRDQTPESGARVPAGSRVVLWVRRDGGTGVREPRTPKPQPRAGRAMRDELSDEAVG